MLKGSHCDPILGLALHGPILPGLMANINAILQTVAISAVYMMSRRLTDRGIETTLLYYHASSICSRVTIGHASCFGKTPHQGTMHARLARSACRQVSSEVGRAVVLYENHISQIHDG